MSDIEVRYLKNKREQCIRTCKLKYRGVAYEKLIEYCEDRCTLQHG